MLRTSNLLAILTLVFVGSINGLSLAQAPGIVSNGSMVTPKSSPKGIDGCWSPSQQQSVPQVMTEEASQCDNLRICEPIAICSPPGQVSPKGCAFRKTHEYILVGDCIKATYNQCYACAGDGQRFCMVYKIFREKHGGTCQRPCDEWQLHFDGTCREGDPIKP